MVVVEGLAVKAGAAGVVALAKRIGSRFGSQAVLDKMTAAEMSDFVFELHARVEQLALTVADIESVDGGLARRMALEAYGSTRDRQKMLAAALAGLAKPDVALEQKSRIARAVASLEVSDVLALRRLVAAKDDQRIIPGKTYGEIAKQIEEESRQALQAAGCVTIRDTIDARAFGRLVSEGVKSQASALMARQEHFDRAPAHVVVELTSLGRLVAWHFDGWDPPATK